ncbi:polysaccharide deacetylase family protein [Paenibacillus tuaregi]|uniref:polysaccharide deacetylase family protein n=1 Tax=Paenibacillus tuaregi TaxID=1816681 RepID=UPI000837CD6E|nr:polysaccharide deacetylase family protein [Paenibacillus tuaregi]
MRLRTTALLLTSISALLLSLVTPAAIASPDKQTLSKISPESNQESLTLSELRKKYSETFKFRGPHIKQVALTFDDVPDPRFTPQVLNILARHHVKATFFVVGARAQKHPELVRRIHREGHMIGNHSYNHPLFKNRDLAYFQKQILRTEKIINSMTGVRPKLIRPPYGEINEDQLRWVKRSGYKVINWNVDSKDWKGLNKSAVKSNILQAAGPGSIILQHAGGGVGADLSGTIQALPDVISVLRKQGYTFVDLKRLLHTQESK